MAYLNIRNIKNRYYDNIKSRVPERKAKNIIVVHGPITL